MGDGAANQKKDEEDLLPNGDPSSQPGAIVMGVFLGQYRPAGGGQVGSV